MGLRCNVNAQTSSLCLILMWFIVMLCICFKVSAQTYSPKSWMHDLSAKIDNKRLREIYIPGTHDSGSWLLGSSARDQDTDFKGQLDAGARFFDLRITINLDTLTYKPETFYLHHGGNSVPEQELIPQLNAIKAFIDNNPSEIVLLDTFPTHMCENFGVTGCDGMQQSHREKLHKVFVDIFGAEAIASEDEILCKDIRYLKDNRKIVVFWGEYGTYPVPVNTSGNFRRHYVDVAHGATIDSKLSQIESEMPDKLRQDHDESKLNVMLPNIWGLNVESTAVDFAHPNIKKWLNEWYNNPEYKKGINIVAIDFLPHIPLIGEAEESFLVKQLMGFNQDLPDTSSPLPPVCPAVKASHAAVMQLL